MWKLKIILVLNLNLGFGPNPDKKPSVLNDLLHRFGEPRDYARTISARVKHVSDPQETLALTSPATQEIFAYYSDYSLLNSLTCSAKLTQAYTRERLRSKCQVKFNLKLGIMLQNIVKRD